MLRQDLLGDLVVFHAQGQDRFAMRVRNKRVEIIDVQLGFQQRRHELIQIGRGIQFYNQQFALGEGEAVLEQEFARLLRVIDHEAQNRAVGRVQNGHGKNVNVVRIEQLSEVMKAAKPISGKN